MCAALCGILNGQPNYITVFNNLTHPQQVIETRIREEGNPQHPCRVLEHYLRTIPEFCELAITSSVHNAANVIIVTKELALGYMAEYFTVGTWKRLGHRIQNTGHGRPKLMI